MGTYTIICTFFSPERTNESRTIEVVAGNTTAISFRFNKPTLTAPAWRGAVFHSEPVPKMGRLADPSYYDPVINQMADQFNCNVVTAPLFFLQPADNRFLRGSPNQPSVCLESTEEIDGFLNYCSEKGLRAIFRLFAYPYGEGGWDDFRNDGYMEESRWAEIDSWLDYHVGHFRKDVKIAAWEIFNEPYFNYPAEHGYNDVQEFIEHVADYVRTRHDPDQPIALGALHLFKNYDSKAILSLHGRRSIADYFDIIGFHAYGPMPYESVTNTPITLTLAALSFGKLAMNLEFGTPASSRNGEDDNWNVTEQAQFFREICEATELQAPNGLLGCCVWHLPFKPNYPFELVEANEFTPQAGGEVIIEFYKSWSNKT